MLNLGVKFNRKYGDIVEEMTQAIGLIEDCHNFFEMSTKEWNQLDDHERFECIRTLSDDIFYGLGRLPIIKVGSGKIEYDHVNHLIKISSEPKIVHMIHLI